MSLKRRDVRKLNASMEKADLILDKISEDVITSDVVCEGACLVSELIERNTKWWLFNEEL